MAKRFLNVVAALLLGLGLLATTRASQDGEAQMVRIETLRSTIEVESGEDPLQQPDIIHNDNSYFTGLLLTNINSYVSARFSPVYKFTLNEIYIAVWNEFNNTTTGCNLYVAQDDGNGLPVWPATYVGALSAPLPHFTWVSLNLASSIVFNAGQDFHVFYGPAPNGTYPGTGWWAPLDSDGTTTQRSSISLDNGNTWQTVTVGDFFIRAGGSYDFPPAGQDLLSWRTLHVPTVNFGVEVGDSFAVWFQAPQDLQLLGIRFMPSNFEGNILVDIFDSPYGGYSGSAVDGTGWLSGGSHPTGLTTPLGSHVAGPTPKTITADDHRSWVNIDIMSQPAFSAGDNFCVTIWNQPTGGMGDAAEDVGTLPRQLFKYYETSPGPDGINSGWFLRSQSLWMEAIVSYSQPQVVINEVMFYPEPTSLIHERNHEWVELFNPGSGSVDVGSWVISNRDASSDAILPSWSVPAGAYLVVHFTSGTNDNDFSDGEGDYYTGPADVFSETMDECALFTGNPNASTIVDFMNWSEEFMYDPGLAYNYALSAHIWTDGDFFTPVDTAHIHAQIAWVIPGESMGRDSSSTDTDASEDWDTFGGPDAIYATPGEVNYTLMQVLGPNPAPRSAAWTVMFYLNGDNNLESSYFGVLDVMEQQGSLPNVNLVVQADFLSEVRQEGFTNRNGHTWRLFLQADNTKGKVYNAIHIGEVNMGSDETLGAFIDWAQNNYPANRYLLIIKDHGAGWKGISVDETSDDDWICMEELKTALEHSNVRLDVMILDACLMGMVEVANQVKGKVDMVVASQEVNYVPDFPFNSIFAAMNNNLGWTSEQLAADIVAKTKANVNRADYTFSAIDCRNLDVLINQINGFGSELKTGVDDYRAHYDPADNVQIRIRSQLIQTEHFYYADFIDLYHFAQLIKADAGIPNAYKTQAQPIMQSLQKGGNIIRAEEHGGGFPNAHGLSIYFPSAQTKRNPPVPKQNTPNGERPFDCPWPSHLPDEPDKLAKYAFDPDDCKPPDEPCETKFTQAKNHPYPPTPGFDFVLNTLWDEFLHRYYEPVADAGEDIFTAVGWIVSLDGSGSSDADGSITRYIWDFDSFVDDPVRCPPDEDEDWDRDCVDEVNDDKDAEGMVLLPIFWEPGISNITLTVWDDHKDQPGHSGHFETDQDDLNVVVIEIDSFEVSEAEVQIVQLNPLMELETVTVTGPTIVEVDFGNLADTDSDTLEQVPTEMTYMNLTGTSSIFGPITVRLNPSLASTGEIEENENIQMGRLDIAPFCDKIVEPQCDGTSASSFFDVYFEIEIELTGDVLHNIDPKHMEGEITYKPPDDGETYESPTVIPLYDESGLYTPYGIGVTRHTPKPETTEVDYFPSSQARVEIIELFSGQTVGTVTAIGPTTVEVDIGGVADTDNDGLEQVTTEMVQLELEGTSGAFGQITVGLNPLQPSTGEIEENENIRSNRLDIFPFCDEAQEPECEGTEAGSFFDVYFEIMMDVPGLGLLKLHNIEPKHMEATITEKPPGSGEMYMDPTIIPLYDEGGQLSLYGIGTTKHTPSPSESLYDDIGIEFIDVPFPQSVNLTIPVVGYIGNNGLEDKPYTVIFYSVLDENGDPVPGYPAPAGPPYPSTPAGETVRWEFEYTPQDTGLYQILLFYFLVDQYSANDSCYSAHFRVYPEKEGCLAYHHFFSRYDWQVGAGGGPAVLFDPPEGIPSFNVQTLEIELIGSGDCLFHVCDASGLDMYELQECCCHNELIDPIPLSVPSHSGAAYFGVDVSEFAELQGMSEPFLVWVEMQEGADLRWTGSTSPSLPTNSFLFDDGEWEHVVYDYNMRCYLNWRGPGCEGIRGDCNGDSTINVIDIVCVANHILGIDPIPPSTDKYCRADCTGDGVINILDALAIANIVLGIIEQCPGDGTCKFEITPEVIELMKSMRQYLSEDDFSKFMALIKGQHVLPTEYSLAQNYPNPFNPITTIEYALPEESIVKVEIYNILGQVIDVLVDGNQEAGYHHIQWDGADMPSGIYFYRLAASGTFRQSLGDYSATKRMVLLK